MRIVITPDIKGDPEGETVYERVIDFALAGRKEGQFLPEPVGHAHLNSSDNVIELVKAIEGIKTDIILRDAHGRWGPRV